MSRRTKWLSELVTFNPKRLTPVVCLSLFVATLCFAQYRASLQGTVNDPQGDVIPGATVTLTSRETSTAKTATTSGAGVYSITGLAPGSYTLSIQAQGFTKKDQDITIANEQARAQDVQLQLASQAAQTVTVSASETPA